MTDSRDSANQLLTRRRLLLAAPGLSLLVIGAVFGLNQLGSASDSSTEASYPGAEAETETKFDFLSKNGNSNCSQAFLASIPSMPDEQRLQGSCCSPMALGRYREQVEGLQVYKSFEVVPSDPYDIPAGLAKRLLEYGKTITPSADKQAVLDQAVADSHEKGYCCCRCWRWSVYEGLSKYLVHTEHFTAGQITDVLNNSDGCGGDA